MQHVDRALRIEAPGQAVVGEEPAVADVPPDRFAVRTRYSGLSAGTELSLFKGTNPYLSSSWDADLGLFRPGEAATSYPVNTLGYMEVATVTASRSPAVQPGDLVAMAYGHRETYLADPLVDRFVPLPPDVEPILGIYVTHMGPICANGLLHAAADQHGSDVRSLADGVAGRCVAVTGAGVVGLLTALFARLHGAARLVVVEPNAQRRAIAEALGLDTLDPSDGDPAVILKTRWRHAANDRGADLVFQCRGQAASLALALRLLRPRAPSSTSPSTRPARTRCGSARSSTTTASPSAAPRSAASRVGSRTPGTASGSPPRPSRCSAPRAPRSSSTWSRTFCRLSRPRSCSPISPSGGAMSCKPSSPSTERAPARVRCRNSPNDGPGVAGHQLPAIPEATIRIGALSGDDDRPAARRSDYSYTTAAEIIFATRLHDGTSGTASR